MKRGRFPVYFIEINREAVFHAQEGYEKTVELEMYMRFWKLTEN